MKQRYARGLLLLLVYLSTSVGSHGDFSNNEGDEGYFTFTPCRNSGRTGPTQAQCDVAYSGLLNKVQVLTESSSPPLPGVQVWTTPHTGQYSVTAHGAAGGARLTTTKMLKGAYVHGRFNFTRGEKIYMLIAQSGSSACSQTNRENPRLAEICRNLAVTESRVSGDVNGSADQQLVGGGGGGATYVFKVDAASGALMPLVVAAGGGGRATTWSRSRTVAQLLAPATSVQGPGSGGGWFNLNTDVLPQTGRSLMQGGEGGQTCARAQAQGWQISGGFGGGGGACSAGGGGGGYFGGNVSVSGDPKQNGQGGQSYVHPSGANIGISQAASWVPDGEVKITMVLHCPCEFMCIFTDYASQDYKCYCSPNAVLADDKHSCIEPEKVVEEDGDECDDEQDGWDLPVLGAVGLTVLACVLGAGLGTAVVFVVMRMRRRHDMDTPPAYSEEEKMMI